MLPFSNAADNNKDAILEKLLTVFSGTRHVLEIGSGTGQHAVHFAPRLPHLVWQPSDLSPNLGGLTARLTAAAIQNINQPLEIDVASPNWPFPAAFAPDAIDAIYTANSLHIMSMAHVEAFFERVGETLGNGGVLCVYGPVRYDGAFTTQSNETFDAQLKVRNPASGIRDFEILDRLANAFGLCLTHDHAMPANNQLLVWKRCGS